MFAELDRKMTDNYRLRLYYHRQKLVLDITEWIDKLIPETPNNHGMDATTIGGACKRSMDAIANRLGNGSRGAGKGRPGYTTTDKRKSINSNHPLNSKTRQNALQETSTQVR